MKISYVTALICSMLMFLLSGCSNNSYLESTQVPEEEIIEEDIQAEDETDQEAPGTIFVQAAGAVKAPGVYELKTGSRVFEVIEMAGGLKPDADDQELNQAGVLSDGQKVYVYRKGEAADSAAAASNPAEGGTSGATASDSALININTADAAGLKNLSGIGDAKASAIISYREANGGFGSIEELTKVDGIGEATLNRLRDQITI